MRKVQLSSLYGNFTDKSKSINIVFENGSEIKLIPNINNIRGCTSNLMNFNNKALEVNNNDRK